MSEYNDILDKIELYTKGKMSLDDKLAFEKDLANNASLREQLEFSQIVDQMVIGAETSKLKEQMQKDLYRTKPKMGKYLAVSLFVLMSSAGLFVLFNKKEDKAQVALPLTVVPKTIDKTEKRTGAQKNTFPVEAKVTVSQEKKTSSKATSGTTEYEVTSVQREVVQNPTAPSSATTIASPNAVAASNVESAPKLVAIAKADPCASLVGDVAFYTVASCLGEESGELHINVESVKGGTAPFTFKLGERSAKARFEQLPAGQYSLIVTDANGCVVENAKKVTVGEKQCRKNKEYAFNPEYDQVWTIPYNKNKEAASMKILDKNGKLFYQTAVSANHPTEWNGESNTGLVLGMGLYLFTIEYADGSLEEGSIVVTR
jgi:hypothetical protein